MHFMTTESLSHPLTYLNQRFHYRILVITLAWMEDHLVSCADAGKVIKQRVLL